MRHSSELKNIAEGEDVTKQVLGIVNTCLNEARKGAYFTSFYTDLENEVRNKVIDKLQKEGYTVTLWDTEKGPKLTIRWKT